MSLDSDLVAILACPVCRAELTSTPGRMDCAGCGRRYPVRDGVPVLLAAEAERPAPVD